MATREEGCEFKRYRRGAIRCCILAGLWDLKGLFILLVQSLKALEVQDVFIKVCVHRNLRAEHVQAQGLAFLVKDVDIMAHPFFNLDTACQVAVFDITFFTCSVRNGTEGKASRGVKTEARAFPECPCWTW
jgi:hypothetical protein